MWQIVIRLVVAWLFLRLLLLFNRWLRKNRIRFTLHGEAAVVSFPLSLQYRELLPSTSLLDLQPNIDHTIVSSTIYPLENSKEGNFISIPVPVPVPVSLPLILPRPLSLHLQQKATLLYATQLNRLVALGPNAAVVSVQGERTHMEDNYSAVIGLNNIGEYNDIKEKKSKRKKRKNNSAWFGVFDGHGGGAASKFSARHLPLFLFETNKKNPFDWASEPELALEWAYKAVEDSWTYTHATIPEENKEDEIKEDKIEEEDSYYYINEKDKRRIIKFDGSTAVCALLICSDLSNDSTTTKQDNNNNNNEQKLKTKSKNNIQRDIWVANVGDSRCVLAHGNRAVELSTDHKPNNPEEKKRIEDLGGSVSLIKGTWRVEKTLALSRAIGDIHLKPYVIAQPDILHRRILDTDTWLILATDGIWDVLSSQDAINLIASCKTANEAASRLVVAGHTLGSQDNLTALVVDLRLH